MIKVIKTESEYQDALAELKALVALDPDPDTPEWDKLEVLGLLVGEYESKTYKFDIPDPVDAIVFRMEQQGLTQRDLIPYLGSRSKVAEILNRTRPLTLAMIRALHSGLGLPAHVLIRETVPEREEPTIDWMRFPLNEMIKRRWLAAPTFDLQNNAETILRQWFALVGGPELAVSRVLFRKSTHVRSKRTMDAYALSAWTARIMMRAKADGVDGPFDKAKVDFNFMRDVAQLSSYKDGPQMAKDFLRQSGIALVIEPHLPRTHLDGAALLLLQEGYPVIGLSLRYDRLDNFWFCLMHELAHIVLHIDSDTEFYDDLDLEDEDDSREREADQLAREALIPAAAWKASPASKLRSPMAAEHLARQLNISPAIVAGRMRYEFKAFRLLNNVVGHGEVRRLFPDIEWSTK